MNRIDEIISHEKLAEEATAEAEDHRWEAARLMYEEIHEGGSSQRKLAAMIGKSQPHVFRYCRAWERYVNVSPADRPSFAKACEQANPPGPAKGQRNQGWEPRGGGRHKADEDEAGDDEEPAQREREGASAWVRTAAEALDMLLVHRAAAKLLTAEDRARLLEMPGKVARILER